jgi:hypothetical protein
MVIGILKTLHSNLHLLKCKCTVEAMYHPRLSMVSYLDGCYKSIYALETCHSFIVPIEWRIVRSFLIDCQDSLYIWDPLWTRLHMPFLLLLNY